LPDKIEVPVPDPRAGYRHHDFAVGKYEKSKVLDYGKIMLPVPRTLTAKFKSRLHPDKFIYFPFPPN
jgi:hypothetical protein